VQKEPEPEAPWLEKSDYLWSNKGPIWAASQEVLDLAAASARGGSCRASVRGPSDAHIQAPDEVGPPPPSSSAGVALDLDMASARGSEHLSASSDTVSSLLAATRQPPEPKPSAAHSADEVPSLLTAHCPEVPLDSQPSLTAESEHIVEASATSPASAQLADPAEARVDSIAAEEMPGLPEKLLQEKHGRAIAALHCQQVCALSAVMSPCLQPLNEQREHQMMLCVRKRQPCAGAATPSHWRSIHDAA
jgi:hypothetical protein